MSRVENVKGDVTGMVETPHCASAYFSTRPTRTASSSGVRRMPPEEKPKVSTRKSCSAAMSWQTKTGISFSFWLILPSQQIGDFFQAPNLVFNSRFLLRVTPTYRLFNPPQLMSV